MTVLIVPDGARFSILGTFNGNPVATVLTYIVQDTTGELSRTEQLGAVAARIIDAWSEAVMDRLSDQYIAEELRILDLDTVDGPVGSRQDTDDNHWPMPGGSTGDPYAGNVCALVKKVTNGGRGTRSGRIYLPGLRESVVVGNNLTDTWHETLQEGVDEFLTRTTNTGIVDLPQSFMTVVHTVNDEYVNNTQVIHLNVETEVATQKRRLRRNG